MLAETNKLMDSSKSIENCPIGGPANRATSMGNMRKVAVFNLKPFDMKKLIVFLLVFVGFQSTGFFAQDKNAVQAITSYFTWFDQGKAHQFKRVLDKGFLAESSHAPAPLDMTAWSDWATQLKAAFPNMKHEILETISEKGKAAVKGIFKGTNSGNFMDKLPTNVEVNLPFNAVFVFKGSKIVSLSTTFDPRSLETQLYGGVENSEKKAKQTIIDLAAAMDAGQTANFSNYCTPDFTYTNPALIEPTTMIGFQEMVTARKKGFDNMKTEILNSFVNGTQVISRGIWRGTHTGVYNDLEPTNNKLEIPFLVVDQLDSKFKIKKREVYYDVKSFENQLMAGISANMEKMLKEMTAAADAGDADKFASYWDPAGVNHFNGKDNTLAETKERVKSLKKAFPDVTRTLDAITICGNKVFIHGIMSGVNSGPFGGKPATNRYINLTWMGEYHFNAKGKIVAGWAEVDFETLTKQLYPKK